MCDANDLKVGHSLVVFVRKQTARNIKYDYLLNSLFYCHRHGRYMFRLDIHYVIFRLQPGDGLKSYRMNYVHLLSNQMFNMKCSFVLAPYMKLSL